MDERENRYCFDYHKGQCETECKPFNNLPGSAYQKRALDCEQEGKKCCASDPILDSLEANITLALLKQKLEKAQNKE